VAFATQSKMKDKCPFTLVMFARAPYFDRKSRDAHSVVSHFRHKGGAWDRAPMTTAMRTTFGHDEAYWPEEDLIEGRYSLVMFESLDGKGRIFHETTHNFQNNFVAALTHVPVVAMITYGTDRLRFFPSMADHVRRGMPLMLLDSRLRWRYRTEAEKERHRRRLELEAKAEGKGKYKASEIEAYVKPLMEEYSHRRTSEPPSSIKEAAECLDQFAKKLNESGAVDFYSTSALSFIKATLENAKKLRSSTGSKVRQSNDEQKQMWIWKALEASTASQPKAKVARAQPKGAAKKKSKKIAQEAKRAEEGKLDGAKVGETSEERDLILATDTLMGYVGGQLEFEMQFRRRRFEKVIENIGATQDWYDLKKVIEEPSNWLGIRGVMFHSFLQIEKFANDNAWLTLKDSSKPINGKKVLVIELPATSGACFGKPPGLPAEGVRGGEGARRLAPHQEGLCGAAGPLARHLRHPQRRLRDDGLAAQRLRVQEQDRRALARGLPPGRERA